MGKGHGGFKVENSKFFIEKEILCHKIGPRSLLCVYSCATTTVMGLRTLASAANIFPLLPFLQNPTAVSTAMTGTHVTFPDCIKQVVRNGACHLSPLSLRMRLCTSSMLPQRWTLTSDFMDQISLCVCGMQCV